MTVSKPRATSEQSGATEGSAAETASESDRVVTLKRPYDLADLLRHVTDDNMHPEQDIGDPKGIEHWSGGGALRKRDEAEEQSQGPVDGDQGGVIEAAEA